MKRRAEHVNETRQRIIDAAIRLHTSVGPAHTTISALADTAGVTRLTVYRHFPSDDELFQACGIHWAKLHPAPDPAAWLMIRPVDARGRRALTDLYRWYRENADDLYPIRRDAAVIPESVAVRARAAEAEMADALVEGCGLRGGARRRLRAAAGHVVSFWTWRSLALGQGLDERDVVDVAVQFLLASGYATAERRG